MLGYSTIFGIDSHARSTTVFAIVKETGETDCRTFKGADPYGEILAWMERFPGPRKGWYEAGCTGYVPARRLTSGDTLVVPIATHALSESAEARARKNDRADAERLARAGDAGQLKEVWVPEPWVEGLRDVCHLLDDLAGLRGAARQRVLSILLRHGHVWEERTKKGALVKMWGQRHWEWLEKIDLGDPASQAALEAYLAEARRAERAYDDALESAARLLGETPLSPVVDALVRVKGVGLVTAMAFAAEVGDFGRFTSGRKITAYFGFAPRERSSSEKRRMGCITKNGCSLVRRLLTECAWRYAGASPSREKGGQAVAAELEEEALRLSRRLAQRRKSLLRRGLHKCKANTATAAELARALWALGLAAQRAAA